MKSLGTLFAIILFILVILGFGYGLYSGWGILEIQWNKLGDGWKPVVFLISTVIVLSTLIAVALIQNGFRNSINVSIGKTQAYNVFVEWYVASQKMEFNNIDYNLVLSLRNQMLLWAGNNVIKQFNLLVEAVSKEDLDMQNIKKLCSLIYLEIQRELGRRGSLKLRQI